MVSRLPAAAHGSTTSKIFIRKEGKREIAGERERDRERERERKIERERETVRENERDMLSLIHI